MGNSANTEKKEKVIFHLQIQPRQFFSFSDYHIQEFGEDTKIEPIKIKENYFPAIGLMIKEDYFK